MRWITAKNRDSIIHIVSDTKNFNEHQSRIQARFCQTLNEINPAKKPRIAPSRTNQNCEPKWPKLNWTAIEKSCMVPDANSTTTRLSHAPMSGARNHQGGRKNFIGTKSDTFEAPATPAIVGYHSNNAHFFVWSSSEFKNGKHRKTTIPIAKATALAIAIPAIRGGIFW